MLRGFVQQPRQAIGGHRVKQAEWLAGTGTGTWKGRRWGERRARANVGPAASSNGQATEHTMCETVALSTVSVPAVKKREEKPHGEGKSKTPADPLFRYQDACLQLQWEECSAPCPWP